MPRKTDSPRKPVSFSLPADVADALKGHSDKTFIPQSRIVEMALRDWLGKAWVNEKKVKD